MRRLSRKQKKRLSNLANIVKNTRKMSLDLKKHNLEYETEIQEVLLDLLESNSNANVHNENIRTGEDIKNYFPVLYNSANLDLPMTTPHISVKNQFPPWAKELWREIVKSCHPDKLDKSLSPEELSLKNFLFMEATKANDNQNADELLLIGVLVEKYTNKISMERQYGKLKSLSTKEIEYINNIQKTIAWQWGNTWDSLESRVKLILMIFKTKNLMPPPMPKIISVLKKYES